MKILIRKRSFFEIVLPLTIVFFVCLGIRFIAAIHGSVLRWVFVFFLFLYLFLNKKLSVLYINRPWLILLFIYLLWCISTTLWSEVSLFSFSKSGMFAFNIIVMLSAGGLWVEKYGYESSLNWLFMMLFIVMFSTFAGISGSGGVNVIAYNAYAGLDRNPNDFGFMLAIVSPLFFLKLYQNKKNRVRFIIWFIFLAADVLFLIMSYSRSSAAIFMCVVVFFALSIPLSKKILITIVSFFLIVITLIMTPVSYLLIGEKTILTHIFKPVGASINLSENVMLQSRLYIWEKSYQQAMKGGFFGGGFAATIGDKHVSREGLPGSEYGREKGNSQLAIMEETGIVGLILYAMILISFFIYVIPYYLRLKGSHKVAMGVVLGAITGLLVESITEGWWDSSAGAELICFWIFVGIVYGMIYRTKRLSD